MKTTLVVCVVISAMPNTSCGSDDGVFDDEEDTGVDPTNAQSEFLARCKAATDLGCQRGFECDNFYFTSRYNSAAHCQSDVAEGYSATAPDLTEHQLNDCAETCDLMLADVRAMSCDDFDDAVFNTYRCGN